MFIAFMPVYLTVHWFSDMVVGLTLGVFWVTFMRLYLDKQQASLVGRGAISPIYIDRQQ